MGHVRNYTLGDVVARFKRAQNFNVLHPMGWDAFGLPAENAAIQNKTSPSDWTYSNIEEMKRQLKLIGLSIDWSKEIATCNKTYFKHQQNLFKDLFDNKLVFKNLTLAPIEKELINLNKLNKKEQDYLLKYHIEVYSKLSKFLSKNEKKWLASFI